MATDLRVEADDRPGQLAAIGGELGKAGINVDGFCAAVAGGRGVLHLLVDDADGARRALEGAGYTVEAAREALVVSGVEDRPGYLGETAGRLAEAGVNIEVAYLGTGTRLVMVVDDGAAAQRAL
ncbi:MAG TPA: ACT domain-containing protein [Acidimicrobiales bacterium]|nr:ACT domain-containing protein [Acidimicrobiales bacterium]